MRIDRGKMVGISSALLSAVCLGVVPVFGKMSLNLGFSPFVVIALRTTLAAALMLIVMAIWMRPAFTIYPIGLVGCMLAGVVNGIGSILYYSALSRLDAGLGHMLYSLYPLFVAFWLLLDRQPITRLTAIRLLLTIPAVFLLVGYGQGGVDLIGAAMMIGSAALYGLHLIINQRVLVDVPAPTVTLYTLLAMSATVVIAYFIGRSQLPPQGTPYWPLLVMAAITFLSRFTLFLGIKHLGGLQTALLGLAELFITILLANLLLHENLTAVQYAGAALLVISLVLVGFDRIPNQKRHNAGWLAWITPTRFPNNGSDWSSFN